MESEEYPYQREWKARKEGNSLGCLALFVIIPLIFLVRHFSEALPNYFGEILFFLFMLTAFVFMIFDKGGWKCPRCKQDFDYRKRIIPAKNCIHCELPIYFGSTFFFDYWGTVQGKEQIQKVKEQEYLKK